MKHVIKKLVVMFSLICIVLGSNFNYASAATDPYLLGPKWNKTQLTYYIDSTSSAPGTIPTDEYLYWNNKVTRAFAMWNASLQIFNINLSFSKTTNSQNADILIRYGYSSSLAHVNNILHNGTLVQSVMTIDDFEMHVNGISDEYLYKVVLHEIGHTIGLANITADHAQANNIYSVMVFDMNSPRHTELPAEFDKLNLLKLY